MVLQDRQHPVDRDSVGPWAEGVAGFEGGLRIARVDGVGTDGVVHEARAHEHPLHLMRIVVISDPGHHHVHVVQRVRRMQEGVGMLQHVDQIALEAGDDRVAHVQRPRAGLEQGHDRGVDVERAAPQQSLGQPCPRLGIGRIVP